MNLWQGVRVLITGGAGFLGSHLAARLVKEGAQVRVADNLERGRRENLTPILPKIEFRQLDLRDDRSCREAVQDREIIFHLASKVGGIGYYLSKPAEVFSQNLLIDTLMLRAAVASGVPRYVYASSAHVYPIELQMEPDAPLIKEEQALPAHPKLSYGWAKLLGEKQIEYAITEEPALRAAIIRLIGVYGPHQDLDLATGSVIPVFTRRAIEYPARKPFTILGTGRETRSYCYVDDIVEAFLLVADKLAVHRLLGPLNLGSEERIMIEDLAREIIAISGKEIEIHHDLSHPTAIWGQALDCSKARELLEGWSPRVSLREGLQKTYAHILDRIPSVA